MQWLEWLIKIGGAVTALGIIWAAVSAAVKATITKMLSKLTKDIERIDKHSHETYISMLRLTIMSSDMPLGERIVAANTYIKQGHNGEVKQFAIEELHVNDIHHNDIER